MQERPAPPKLVLEVGKPPAAGAAVLVVLAADRQADAVSRRHDHRGRPDLDVDLHYLARLQRLLAVVRVIGPVGARELLVELAMRGPEPTLADGRVGIDGALEHDFPEVG